jgi:hypothetical protein
MSTLQILKSGKRLPFKYETGSPHARPIAKGLRHAVAQMRAQGRRVEYFMRLENRHFVYYVQTKRG